MIKVISLLLIGTLATTNLSAIEAGDYCIGGKCYSKLKPRETKKRQEILKIDDSYELEISMEIEKQKIDGKKPIIIDSGFDEYGKYTETFIYANISSRLTKDEEKAPKYFCPDKKTLYCDDIAPNHNDCRCV